MFHQVAFARDADPFGHNGTHYWFFPVWIFTILSLLFWFRIEEFVLDVFPFFQFDDCAGFLPKAAFGVQRFFVVNFGDTK